MTLLHGWHTDYLITLNMRSLHLVFRVEVSTSETELELFVSASCNNRFALQVTREVEADRILQERMETERKAEAARLSKRKGKK